MKRIVSLIVIAMLLCIMGGAYAQNIDEGAVDTTTAQYESTKLFLALLDAENVNYTYVGIDNNGYEKVDVPNTDSELGISYTLKFFFDANNENASIRVWDVATVDESKIVDALIACNSSHQAWKYVTFMVENDNTITAKMDLIFRGESAGEVCWEATLHTVNVIAAAYPEYLGALAEAE